ncbi:MAG: 50S ribosome-binding GTPase [Clostridiales bacterium]|nr:MAG: 50S ribosome-binding GTPase [Clostridiales bacterium]
MKVGFITIAGKPNAGKSTLLNAMVGEKVAIVSWRPQTTRNKITGIVNGDDYQLVFTDTPGLHNSRNKLGDYMMKKRFDRARRRGRNIVRRQRRQRFRRLR